MSQRSHKFRASRTSRVSGNFMGSRPSVGAPVMSGQPLLEGTRVQTRVEMIDLTNDSDESSKKPERLTSIRREPPEQGFGAAPALGFIDLTDDSPPPSPPRNRQAAFNSASREPAPMIRSPLARSPSARLSRDVSPRSPLPRLTRDSSPDEPARTEQEDLTTVKNASSPQIKVSPQSFQNQRKETPSAKRQVPRQNVYDSTPQLEADEDEDHDAPMSQNLQPSPSIPSKHTSRGHRSSQKSADFSIGSSSPLITRLQQRRNSLKTNDTARPRSQSSREVMSQRSMSSEHTSRNQPPTLDELEKSLGGFESRLKDDHALGMRWLFQDVRETAADRESSFFEAPFAEKGLFTPWASKRGVQIRPGESINDAPHIDKLDSFIMTKSSKFSKTKTQLQGSLIMTDLPRVPKYYSHTNVRRNILTADDEKLKFIPFLGDALGQGAAKKDNFRRLLKELEEAYSAKRSESSRETERASEIKSHLDVWLKELKIDCTQEDLTQYILSNDDSSEELQLKPWERKAILKSFGEPLIPNVYKSAEVFSESFQNVFGLPLHDVILPSERVKELVESARKSVSKTPEKPANAPAERIETYTTLTCMICGAIDCPTHGDYQQYPLENRSDDEDEESDERDREYVYSRQALILEYEAMKRKYDIRRLNPPPEFEYEGRAKNKHPCSDECYMAIDYSDREYEWSRGEIEALPQMLVALTNRDRRSCNIAFSIDRPCWQVHSEIATYEAEHPDTPEEVEESTARAKAPNWYDNKRRILKGDWQEMTSAHLHQERAQANPCGHEGPCTNTCPCFQANLLCESFCGCPDDCPRKFTGCACLSSGIACVTESCICIQMNRECGPQCGTCGAIDRINPARRDDDNLFKSGCQNIVLQRGVAKKLVMGESQLEGVGFGLYVVEPVQKGDYLSEYAGEVVSSAEAERRGIIYDRKFLSFLFDLNGDWVIDAARYGNKTRFINHADNEKDGLNCEAKIVLVNGEHRIKFVALRDINVGEELLFNYGKKFAEKHGLSKKLPKVKEGGKKGVLVGEEALDALDGMDSRKRVTRGKMSDIRGAKVKGKGKMRKTAVVPEPVVEVGAGEAVEEEFYGTQMEEDEDEEGEEEGEDDRDRRRRRKITRPARYTR